MRALKAHRKYETFYPWSGIHREMKLILKQKNSLILQTYFLYSQFKLKMVNYAIVYIDLFGAVKSRHWQ